MIRSLISLIVLCCFGCTISNNYKFKRIAGDVWRPSPGSPLTSSTDDIISLDELLFEKRSGKTSLYSISIIDRTKSFYYQAQPISTNRDSTILAIQLRDKEKDSISFMTYFHYARKDVTNFTLIKKDADRLVVRYHFTDSTKEENIRPEFEFHQIKAIRMSGGMATLITGKVFIGDSELEFVIINDPEEITIPLGEICAIGSTMPFTEDCEKRNWSIAKQKRTECTSKIICGPIQLFRFKKTVNCHITCK